MTDTSAVTAITSINLSQYLGKWYELCRLPIKYEDETATDIVLQLECEINGGVEPNHAEREAYRLKHEPDEETAAEMAEEEAELMEQEWYDPDNSGWTEIDQSSMINFQSDSDDEWGMGWNPDVCRLSEHPRYQVHVMLRDH